MKIKSNNLAETASTLTEVLAAVAILAIAMGGLMGALANGFHTMQMARENQRATQILMEKAEFARLYNWDQITNGTFMTEGTEHYDPSNEGTVAYQVSTTVDAVPFATSYSADMRRITVRVTWKTKGIDRERELTTLVSKDGMQNYFL
jgi:type II secretory pathway pseudopilin PulG